MTRRREKTAEPTPARLLEALHYDPLTGALTWKHRSDARKEWNSRYAGQPAFQHCCPLGYHRGQVDGVRMLAHRAAWAIHHGEPAITVDHLNGDPSDNRIANLRSVDHQTNMRNMRRRRDNTTGFTGVVKTPGGRFLAQSGPLGYIGTFDTAHEAHAAYMAKVKALGFRLRGEAEALQAAAVARGC